NSQGILPGRPRFASVASVGLAENVSKLGREIVLRGIRRDRLEPRLDSREEDLDASATQPLMEGPSADVSGSFVEGGHVVPANEPPIRELRFSRVLLAISGG